MPWNANPRTYAVGERLRALWLNQFQRDNTNYLKGRLLAQWPAQALSGGMGTTRPRGPLEVLTANLGYYVWEFAADDDQQVHGFCTMPVDHVGDESPQVKLTWDSDATSGAVRWQVRAQAIGAGEADPTAALSSSVAFTATVNATANRKTVTTLTLAISGVEADDLIYWTIRRIGSNSGDTAAGVANLRIVTVEAG